MLSWNAYQRLQSPFVHFHLTDLFVWKSYYYYLLLLPESVDLCGSEECDKDSAKGESLFQRNETQAFSEKQFSFKLT